MAFREMLSFSNQISVKTYSILVHLALALWDKGTVLIGNRWFEFILRVRCSVANYFKINFEIQLKYFKKTFIFKAWNLHLKSCCRSMKPTIKLCHNNLNCWSQNWLFGITLKLNNDKNCLCGSCHHYVMPRLTFLEFN